MAKKIIFDKRLIMRAYIVGLIKKIVGVALIIGGIAGLFLPFFQGIAMIIAGAILLDNDFILSRARRFVAYLKRLRKKP